jgi:hypothetical protein
VYGALKVLKVTEKYFEIYYTGMEETRETLENPITIMD